jgi:hypothetical protein
MTLYANLRPWIPHPEATLVILHGAIDVATALLYWEVYRPQRRIDRAIAMQKIDDAAEDLHFRASMILQEALTAGHVKATGHLAGGTSSSIVADDWVRLTKVSMWGDEFAFADGRRVSDVLICTDDLRRLLTKLMENLTGKSASATPTKAPRLKSDDVERQYRSYMASLPADATDLRGKGEAFLRGLNVSGSVREMAKRFNTGLSRKPKKGRPRKGITNSAK